MSVFVIIFFSEIRSLSVFFKGKEEAIFMLNLTFSNSVFFDEGNAH